MAATQHEIARLTGLSRSTVSGILAGKFTQNYHEETRRQVLEAAEKLSYRPNRQALTLKTGKSGIIGIVHTGSVLPLTHQKISAVVKTVTNRGLEPLVYHNTWFENSEGVVDMLLANKVQGVVLINNYYESAELNRLVKTVPVVQLGGVKQPGVPLIATDTASTVCEIVHHLVEEGWKKIVMLVPSKEDSLLNPVAAFKEALAEIRKKVAHEIVMVPWEETDKTDVYAPGARGLQLLEDSGARGAAVIAHDDNWAIGFYLQCLREGIGIPDDYGLVGYDNVLLGGRMPSTLTSVEQPIVDMADEAVALLLKPKRDPKFMKLAASTLIRRESSLKKQFQSNRYS